jgi:prepilin-type N-terminal cleavage/methylation domain-containing protein
MLTSERRRGMTLIEIMIVVVIIAIIFAYAFVNAGNYTERSKYARVGEDIGTLTSAVAVSNLESAGDWKGVEASSTTGKADAFAGLFTGDGGTATAKIDRRLSKTTALIKDPWGQPYDLVVKTEDGKKVMYILCRPGTAAVNSLTSARTNKFDGDRPMGIRIKLD